MDPISAAALTLSLRPPFDRQDEEPLHSVLLRIKEERTKQKKSSFKDITEASLREEIANGEDEAEDSAEDMEDEREKELDAKAIQENFNRKREEMLEFVRLAHNDAMILLDFLALLESKDAPQAEASMSVDLKGLVPSKTLGHDKWQMPERTEEQKRAERQLAEGINIQSLGKTADDLLGAAKRLENTIEKETKYWEQILSISDKGWALSALPRERHTLGVRFGFSEASPIFQGRGLAALRSDEDGNIIVGQLTSKPRALRVRIQKDGQVISTSQLPNLQQGQTGDVEDRIRQGRDALYEEELFDELVREYRSVSALGVKFVDHTIHVSLNAQGADIGRTGSSSTELLLDLVDPNDTLFEEINQPSDYLADTIALSLRVLLTYTHRKRLERRSHPPPPLSERKQPNVPESLLRPVINHFAHNSSLHSLKQLFDKLTAVFRSASLTLSTEIKLPTPFQPSGADPKPATPETFETICSHLIGPLTASASLTIDETGLTIDLRTYHSAAPFGSEFKLTAPTDLIGVVTKPVLYYNRFSELQEQIEFLLTLHLTKEEVSKRRHSAMGTKTGGSIVDSQTGKRVEFWVKDGTLGAKVGGQTYAWDGTPGKRSFADVIKDALPLD